MIMVAVVEGEDRVWQRGGQRRVALVFVHWRTETGG